ncbi:MAG TPA: TetR/AcrR family transcriptional regulator C-terminal ligand-binding domain-containing protein [Actinocrinis sp.]|nr:TetR/AcrR family transcriptional regulator C-terminal ligand-binding domain-containing protein [Actinocrinis sp.]
MASVTDAQPPTRSALVAPPVGLPGPDASPDPRAAQIPPDPQGPLGSVGTQSSQLRGLMPAQAAGPGDLTPAQSGRPAAAAPTQASYPEPTRPLIPGRLPAGAVTSPTHPDVGPAESAGPAAVSTSQTPASAPARPHGRPRSAAADAAILAATRDLLAEQGWDRLSLGEVAARAGVAKTTLYRRWPGKTELVVDAMAEIFGTLRPVDAGSVRADAAAVIADLVALLSRPETQAAFLALAAESARDPRLRTVVREKIIDRQRHLVLCGAARAEARAETSRIHDPGLVFDVITGTIVHRLLIAGEPVDQDYLDRFLDFLLAALEPSR